MGFRTCSWPTSAEVGPGTLSILHNAGRAALSAPEDYIVGSTPRSIITTDIDGDGRLDVLTANERGRSVSILRSRGDGKFDPETSLPIDRDVDDVEAADLDGDGVLDLALANFENQDEDVSGDVGIVLNLTRPSASRDRDANGIPDECDARPFRRGDTNGDGVLDIADPIALVAALFLGGVQPGCLDAADADDDGTLVLTDAIYTLNRLFRGGPSMPAPGADSCGPDATDDSLFPCVQASSC